MEIPIFGIASQGMFKVQLPGQFELVFPRKVAKIGEFLNS